MTMRDQDNAAAEAMQIVDIEPDARDVLAMHELCDLLTGAKHLQRRKFDGVEQWTGTAADSRLFTALVVSGERALVDFLPWTLRTGPTDTAANDGPLLRR